MTDKELINQINHKLDRLIRKNLQTQGEEGCEKALKDLRNALLKARKLMNTHKQKGSTTPLNIVIQATKEAAFCINKEVKSLEKESHGVENYTAELNNRLRKIKHKIELRNGLYNILQLVHAEHPTLTEEFI